MVRGTRQAVQQEENQPPTLDADCARSVADLLAAAPVARLDAEVLIGHVLGKDRAWFYAYPDAVPGREQCKLILALLQRRADGEPLAYITGNKEFWSLPIHVNSDVLIPRPETELLVELALERLPSDGSPNICDPGTGSGCIAIALAKERPPATVTAVDNSPEALTVAARNAQDLAVDNIEFLRSNWFTELDDQRFDLIVCNPPYVEDGDSCLFDDGVRFEPVCALAAGTDGLDAIRVVAQGAREYLKTGGHLILEHGHDQQETVKKLLERSGYSKITGHRDLNGLDRAVSAVAHG